MVEFIPLVIAIGTAAASLVAWYTTTVRYRYARERENGHILRNLENQSQAFAQLFKDLDSLADRLSRLEVLLLKRGVDRDA